MDYTLKGLFLNGRYSIDPWSVTSLTADTVDFIHAALTIQLRW